MKNRVRRIHGFVFVLLFVFSTNIYAAVRVPRGEGPFSDRIARLWRVAIEFVQSCGDTIGIPDKG
jgi:uncharacterized membrane protein